MSLKPSSWVILIFSHAIKSMVECKVIESFEALDCFGIYLFETIQRYTDNYKNSPEK